MSQHHTIGKLLLELQLPASQNAQSLQNKLGGVCKEDLVAALQELLDSWADAGTLLQVDRLEIDLGECTAQQLEKELTGRVISYLRDNYLALQEQGQLGTGMERCPMTQGYFDSWLYFLEHGLLPDTSYINDTTAWEAGVLEILATATPALERCRRVLETKPAAISRMVLQFSRQFIQHWIQAYAGPSQQLVMQMSRAWEQYCCSGEFLSQLRSKISARGLTLPSLPERTELQRRLDELSIRQILSLSQVPAPAILLEQMIALSFGAEQLPEYIHALRQLPSLPGEGAELIKAALHTLHNRYVSAGKTNTAAMQVETAARQHDNNQPSIPERRDATIRPLSEPDEQSGATAKATDGPAMPAEERKDKLPPGTDHTATGAGTRPDANERYAGAESRSRTEALPAEQSISGKGAATDPGHLQSSVKKPASADNRAEHRKKPGTPPEGLSTYINNAGLVLLHPYLHIFFDALGLLEKRAFKTPAAQDKAVQLLGFLASGESDVPEYDLAFPKLLCGLLPEEPVDRFVELTELDKAEANQLLEAVINNWNALGSTSADGLRGNFLMREGKLQWQGDEWRLRVTQTSYDLLLNRLPWALSVVRLPWMPWVLKTEWV